jgi:MFS family permease
VVAVAVPLLVVTGAGHIVYLNCTNSLLQSQADPAMRGRVMSFYSQLVLGSTPIGAPIVGYLADHFGVRSAIVAAGGVAVTASLVALRSASPTP